MFRLPCQHGFIHWHGCEDVIVVISGVTFESRVATASRHHMHSDLSNLTRILVLMLAMLVARKAAGCRKVAGNVCWNLVNAKVGCYVMRVLGT